jgi:hypothetical protein
MHPDVRDVEFLIPLTRPREQQSLCPYGLAMETRRLFAGQIVETGKSCGISSTHLDRRSSKTVIGGRKWSVAITRKRPLRRPFHVGWSPQRPENGLSFDETSPCRRQAQPPSRYGDLCDCL